MTLRMSLLQNKCLKSHFLFPECFKLQYLFVSGEEDELNCLASF